MPGEERNMPWIGATYEDHPRMELRGLETPEQAAFSTRARDKLLREFVCALKVGARKSG